MRPRQRRRPTHPMLRLDLPPLDAGSALTLVDVLERIITALWAAHGDRMIELRGLRPARPAPDPDDRYDAAPDLDF